MVATSPRRWLLARFELVVTSGTTADQVMNVWVPALVVDAHPGGSSWQLNARARAVATGTHREAILTSPWCAGVPCEDGYLSMASRSLDRFLYLSERSDPSLWADDLMGRMVDELNTFQPAVLEANPSFLAEALSPHCQPPVARALAGPDHPDLREPLDFAPAPDRPGF